NRRPAHAFLTRQCLQVGQRQRGLADNIRNRQATVGVGQLRVEGNGLLVVGQQFLVLCQDLGDGDGAAELGFFKFLLKKTQELETSRQRFIPGIKADRLGSDFVARSEEGRVGKVWRGGV